MFSDAGHKLVGKEDLVNVSIKKLHVLKYIREDHFENRALKKIKEINRKLVFYFGSTPKSNTMCRYTT